MIVFAFWKGHFDLGCGKYIRGICLKSTGVSNSFEYLPQVSSSEAFAISHVRYGGQVLTCMWQKSLEMLVSMDTLCSWQDLGDKTAILSPDVEVIL